MDRINANSSQPLTGVPASPPKAPLETQAAPAYKPDSFSPVRPRTKEQAEGMRPLDTPSLISMLVGGAGFLGSVGLAVGMLTGALAGGPATLALCAILAVGGIVPLGLGIGRYLARKSLLDEG